jgi:hypothetical protein
MLWQAFGRFGGLAVTPEASSDDILFYGPAPVSNTFDITGLDLSGIQRVILFLDGITVDTANTDVIVQFYIAGALVTTGYRYTTANNTSAVGENDVSSGSAAHVLVTDVAATGANISLCSRLEINVGGKYKLATSDTARMGSSGGLARVRGGGLLENNGSLTGMKISGSGGLITGGQALLLAMQTS